MEDRIGNSIQIVSLNILLGRVGSLEDAICALQQVNLGIGILYEMKLMVGDIHMADRRILRMGDRGGYQAPWRHLCRVAAVEGMAA